MDLIMRNIFKTAFNSLDNLNLKNYLKSLYDLPTDYSTKVKILKIN